MSKAPVHRLHQAIQKLKTAQHAQHDDKVALRTDERALKHDQHHIAHQRDVFESAKKTLTHEHDALGKLRAAEKKKLDPLARQEATLQQQVNASVDPLTGQPDPALQMQLAAVQQSEAGVRAHFDPLVAADKAKVDHLRQQQATRRSNIQESRTAIAKDHREVKGDKRHLTRAEHVVAKDKEAARKDLLPAEYKMGLKATNQARHDLGLKAVHHVVRPGVANVVGGQVGKWIAEAQTVLKQHGVPLSKMNAHDIALIIQHESGGNPKAVNNWDSNAAAGTPSEGLMQTIGPTFNSYKLAGHGHILNPVDNIIAGVRYAISRYGSISNVPGVRAVHAGGSYVGY